MEGWSLIVGHLQAGLLAAVFLLLLGVERVAPLRRSTRRALPRFFVNFSFMALAFIAGSFAVRPVSLWLADQTSQKSFGLLSVLGLPAGVHGAAGFLLMDLTFYYWHRLNHTVPLLWRFHNVHHVDPDLDVTTSFRFHFGEILYSTGFRVVQVGLLGVSVVTYLVYEFFFQAGTMFHHSNIMLPIRIERRLNKIIVTPRMHGIHHSIFKNETNSNYGVIFRWWDVLHRSMRLNIPQASIDIGIAGYRKPHDNTLRNLLLLPFRTQRDYWRREDGRPAESREIEMKGRLTTLSE
ncbi:MAG: sterol desaturase family protein [Candidatus Abyssobacteria bacterium SURF_5]|uniref:Sterol desaturase family protein n=1 Tax=Abyssobacteria bacterium (strain SURF_5) TaxID=2093360 RepID=A0A3A4N3N6_ABYX5|nr:MAG: sterol desaturase family protein [Candidatus Abyssubacteria bacterium SURF_5]